MRQTDGSGRFDYITKPHVFYFTRGRLFWLLPGKGVFALDWTLFLCGLFFFVHLISSHLRKIDRSWHLASVADRACSLFLSGFLLAIFLLASSREEKPDAFAFFPFIFSSSSADDYDDDYYE